MILRTLEQQIRKRWVSEKAIIVMGPRQVGKTTLLKKLCQELSGGSYLYLNADDIRVRQDLSGTNLEAMRKIFGRHPTVFIDEAQRISNIGLSLKLIVDEITDIRLVVSGSSSFDLANEINEPIKGRKWEYLLLPISWKEYAEHYGSYEARRKLDTRLIFGMYPEIITSEGEEVELLQQLTGSYLYKDILNFKGMRKPEILDNLLIALALQVGSEVSYNELAQLLQIDRATVENYLTIFEKAFVIFRLNPLSRNLRNEINSSRKIYFYDNGVRNSILGDYKSPGLRADKGALWENFIISEMIKKRNYQHWYGKHYFWRTYQGQEIDLIEEIDGNFSAYEIKYNSKGKSRISKTFLKNYPIKDQSIIDQHNFEDMIM